MSLAAALYALLAFVPAEVLAENNRLKVVIFDG